MTSLKLSFLVITASPASLSWANLALVSLFILVNPENYRSPSAFDVMIVKYILEAWEGVSHACFFNIAKCVVGVCHHIWFFRTHTQHTIRQRSPRPRRLDRLVARFWPLIALVVLTSVPFHSTSTASRSRRPANTDFTRISSAARVR